MRPVTQKDIARALKIGQTTVGLVLGKTDSPLRQRLSTKTIQRVRKKARAMGYFPHHGARVLRTQRSNLIVFLSFDPFTELSGFQTYEIGRLVHEAGYDFQTINARWWAGRAQSMIEQLMGHRPEGIIISGSYQIPFELRHIHELVRRNIPVVSLRGDIAGIPRVRHDAEEAFRQLTANAIRAGRRRLLCLLGEECPNMNIRARGFESAILQAGAASPQKLQGLNFSFSKDRHALESAILFDSGRLGLFENFTRGQALVEQILQKPELPDALICSNDEFAIAAMTVCARKGIAVPDSIFVSGFDNRAYGTQGAVTLTSVEQPIGLMCQAAVKMLTERMGASLRLRKTPEEKVFPCQVIWRESNPRCNPVFWTMKIQ